jgi:hypothetical protein
MRDLKETLNAKDAEVFAKARREVPCFAYLCENLCALCVKEAVTSGARPKFWHSFLREGVSIDVQVMYKLTTPPDGRATAPLRCRMGFRESSNAP